MQPERKPIIPAPSLIVEKNRLTKERNIVNFLNQLKRSRPINRIYYPGPGLDDSLNVVFKPEEISYVGRETFFPGVSYGLYANTPQFKDGEFDAIFLQDTHQKPTDFREFLRVLKGGGIIVQSLYGCGNDDARGTINVGDVINQPALVQKTLLPGWDHLFLTLEKIGFQK